MATLTDLYSKYYPGQDQRGTYDSYSMAWGGAIPASALAFKAAQAGDLEGWLTAKDAASKTTVYDDTYNMTGARQEGSFNPLGFYSGNKEVVVRDALQAIAQSAGVPSYDWTGAINTAAMQLAKEFGGQSPTSETRLPDLIDRIVQKAPDQQIQQTYAQTREQIRPVLEEQYQQIWNQSKDYKSAKFKTAVISMAAIALGGYLGATAGAAAGGGAAATGAGATAGAGTTATAGAGLTASELAAADIALGGAGGSAGAASLGGAGAATAASAAGLTAAEEAAMLGAADTGGGAVAGGAATGGATTTGTTSGGMQPGVGEYGELGTAGWEGGIPGGPGVIGGAGATAGGATALSRILQGGGTLDDYLALTGQVAPSLLGMYASGKQTDALKDQAAQYAAMGAPYRSRLASLYENPNAFLTSPEVTVPVQQGTDIMARSLSTTGNPTGSGNALQKLQSYSADQLFGRLGQEKDRLGGFGGLSAYNQAAPQAATNAIGSQANFYNAAGAGIADVFGTRRQRSLADLLREGGY